MAKDAKAVNGITYVLSPSSVSLSFFPSTSVLLFLSGPGEGVE